jgi:2-iminoacetate synthase ThiH
MQKWVLSGAGSDVDAVTLFSELYPLLKDHYYKLEINSYDPGEFGFVCRVKCSEEEVQEMYKLIDYKHGIDSPGYPEEVDDENRQHLWPDAPNN